MKFGADANIYRVEQDCGTFEIILYAYGREEERVQGERIYQPQELYEMLCEFSRAYQNGRND